MLTLYTVISVVLLFVVAVPASRRMYPNGSGSAFPRWVYGWPNQLLGTLGALALSFGCLATWVSGQVFFAFSGSSIVELLLAFGGMLVGVVIALYGLAFFGVVLKKNKKASSKDK